MSKDIGWEAMCTRMHEFSKELKVEELPAPMFREFPMEHEVKISTEFFNDVASGKKPFEVRINDRDYRVDDTLRLKGYLLETKEYTGEMCIKKITYILDSPTYMQQGFVILGLAEVIEIYGDLFYNRVYDR